MKEDIEHELRDISPFLADLKKAHPDANGKLQPFKTPKFYFDTLADRVLEKTQPVAAPVYKQYQAKKSIFAQIGEWVSALMQPRWAIAMASVMIVAVGTWFYMKQPENTMPQTLTEISSEDIHDYIKDNIDDFEEDLLAENGITASDTEGGTIFTEMSDNEVELYLNEHLDEKDLDNINGKL